MQKKLDWIYLAHLGYNMWYEPVEDKLGVHCVPYTSDKRFGYVHATDKMRFENSRWEDLTRQLKEAGCTTILLDLGEGLQYESHPELAAEGAWSKEKLAEEISRLKAMGIELLPKLNFSACHDQWMGEYGRMLSTSVYYRVARDLISEVCELFDNPRMFHLGMDEETPQHQVRNNIMIIRQGDLWWYDLNRLADFTRAAGSRPWIWSDYGWGHWDEFRNRMSRDIVQSNWYYGEFANSEPDLTYYTLYDKLESAGFDQIPAGSSCGSMKNFPMTVDYCGSRIAPERLLGYMQTVWAPVMEETKIWLDDSVNSMAEGIKR